jgi:hypothetical protein
MRYTTVALVWLGGVLLAAALYVVGPDRFIASCLDAFDTLQDALQTLALVLGARAYDVLRALAIALYIVFLVLALMAARRGFRAVGPLVVVSILFLALVWRPFSDRPPGSLHWLAALAVVTVAAAGMTRQLVGPPPGGPWPYANDPKI